MLKRRRQELELTQYDLAKASGVANTRISLAERNLIELSEWEKSKISEVLGVPAPELFSRTGENALYRELRRFLTLEERSWLLDVGHDPEIYEVRLKILAEKYHVGQEGA